MAGAYGQSKVTSLSVDGDADSTATSSDTAYLVTSLLLGYRWPNANYLNGHISRLAYYPERLSDEQLVALTV